VKAPPAKILLTRGDVSGFEVIHEGAFTRLLVFQDFDPVPLIQARLTDEERLELVRALLGEDDSVTHRQL
jgi:hypothetical protein